MSWRKNFLAGFLATVIGSSSAFGRSTLHIQYEPHASKIVNKGKKEVALKVPLLKGVSYYLMAELYTGSKANAPALQAFNDNAKLVYDAKHPHFMFIPQSLLRPAVKRIFDENKFSTFEIDEQGSEGIKNLWDIADGFLNNTLSMNEKISILIILNDEINPLTNVVYQGQKILVPDSLIDQGQVEKEEKPEHHETPKAKVVTKKVPSMQNPYRTDIDSLKKKLHKKDLFGANRIRTIGKGKYKITKHQGIDLISAVGTRLYPIQAGTVVRAGKDKVRWRNGNIVEYETVSGLLVTYCHLSKVLVKLGQKITTGTNVGAVGVTGNASKNYPHVHVQVRKGGKVVNPALYVLVDTPE